MPSPIGHMLAGVAISGSVPTSAPHESPRAAVLLTLLLAALAAIPDADLLLPVVHRGASHSVAAIALVSILAMGVTRWVTGGVHWRMVLVCAAAYASHPLLDWLGTDTYLPRGVQIFWPFSDRFFISNLDLFPRLERRNLLSLATFYGNLRAGIAEVLILGPVALLPWLVRRLMWPGDGARSTRRTLDQISDRGVLQQPYAEAVGRGDTSDPRSPRAGR